MLIGWPPEMGEGVTLEPVPTAHFPALAAVITDADWHDSAILF